MIEFYRKAIVKAHPLIHCITNPISITQCANAVLAIGGRPIMAEHPGEVAEITRTADGLLLNLGNITDVRMESMKISLKEAVQCNIPVVLDAVGVACSHLRRDYVNELFSIGIPTVVKGNYSEILALANVSYQALGVDAEEQLSKPEITAAAIHLAKEYKTMILASGKTDILTDGTQIIYIENGSPQLATITGTGCMLGAMSACYLSAKSDIQALVTACAVLGISGELSETERGCGSFYCNLLDHIQTISEKEIHERIRIEVKTIEEI